MTKETSSKIRWAKWWHQDHQGDLSLHACSLAARGLWMEILAVCFMADPHGYLMLNSQPVTMKKLAAIAGAAESVVAKLVAELEEAGVFSRKDGVIYSRRMVRDRAASELGKVHGLRGGNPNLLTDEVNQHEAKGVNPPSYQGGLSGGDKLEAEREEERESERESEKKESPLPPKQPGSGKSGRRGVCSDADFDAFWNLYRKKEGKIAARKAFASAAAKAPIQDIMAGLAKFEWNPNPQYWPQPAKWLKDGRWDDEPMGDPVLRAAGLDENTRRLAELTAELMGTSHPPADFFAGTTLDGDLSLVQ